MSMPTAAPVPTEDQIRQKLITDDLWLVRGLLAIYAKQTQDERSNGNTAHHNGVGFTGVDAPFCSSLVEQFRSRGTLSPKQIAALRKIMPKYSRQLHRIAVGKSNEPQPPTQ